MIQFLIEPIRSSCQEKFTYGGSSYAKEIGSPLRSSWICDMCIDARKTSLTGVQKSKKNRLAATRLVHMWYVHGCQENITYGGSRHSKKHRLAATRLVDDAPAWKKARSADGMWGKNVFFFVMLLPRGKILISSAKYWFLGMRILKSSNTTRKLWCSLTSSYFKEVAVTLILY